MSMEKNLNNFIQELIQEIEKELDEATTTASVDGYNTPFAFGSGRKKDKKKKDDIVKSATGYTRVAEGLVSPKRKKKISTQFGMKIVGKIDESKFAKKPEVTPKQLLKIQNDVRKVNRKIKVYISKHPVTKGRLEIELGHGHDNDAEIDTLYGILKNNTGSWRTGTMFNESLNEAKVKRPVNRWLELKNDETMHPHKKMAMGLKELKYQLRETEKFFNWYNKIKTMNELDSNQYWKRTNKHIYSIKEKLINIAKTIQEIEK